MRFRVCAQLFTTPMQFYDFAPRVSMRISITKHAPIHDYRLPYHSTLILIQRGGTREREREIAHKIRSRQQFEECTKSTCYMIVRNLRTCSGLMQGFPSQRQQRRQMTRRVVVAEIVLCANADIMQMCTFYYILLDRGRRGRRTAVPGDSLAQSQV